MTKAEADRPCQHLRCCYLRPSRPTEPHLLPALSMSKAGLRWQPLIYTSQHAAHMSTAAFGQKEDEEPEKGAQSWYPQLHKNARESMVRSVPGGRWGEPKWAAVLEIWQGLLLTSSVFSRTNKMFWLGAVVPTHLQFL